jgi:hypothetical protein
MDSSQTELFNYVIVAEALFCFCYVVSSLFLLSNPYAGFVSFVYGLALAASVCLKWWSVRAKDRVLYGATVGVVILMVGISLEQAIFWGQSAGCASAATGRRLLGVECNQVGAMRSVCTFSVFMFLADIVFLFLLLRFKDALLPLGPGDAKGAYLGTSSKSMSGAVYAQVPQPTSTDL